MGVLIVVVYISVGVFEIKDTGRGVYMNQPFSQPKFKWFFAPKVGIRDPILQQHGTN